MFKNMKISIKILLVIMVMSLGSLLIIFGASAYFMNSMVDEFEQTNITLGLNSSTIAKESLLDQANNYLVMIVEKQAQAANEKFYSVNRIVTESAEYTSSLYTDSSNFVGKDIPAPDETVMGEASSKYFLVKGIEETPEIQKEVLILSNCEYMFAPFLENTEILNNIYIGTQSGISYRYSRSNQFNPDYDPRARDWYIEAMNTPGTLVWLPTYLDSYGNTCITAAMTYDDASGNRAGVVASDVALQDLIDDVMSMKVGDTGACFILDDNYNFIAHKDMDEASFDPDINNHFDNDDFIKALSGKTSGIVETVYEDENSYVAFSKLEETGWIFCASINTSEVTLPADHAKEQSDMMTATSQEEMQKRLFDINKLFIIYFAVIGIILIMVSFAVSGTITRPMQALAKNVKAIGKGNFDIKIPVESGDEVGQLAERFNEMQDDLKTYMEDVKYATAEKERIGTELNVATQIQASMLPSIFPVYSEKAEYKIYATMHPAKEVGGDFYDFFYVDEDHLAMVVADVSGKGVPAALFMVIGKTLIKDHTKPDTDPSSIFEEVNSILCESNEGGMFITAYEAVIDLRTGEVRYANAGHEHPFIMHKGEDGKYVYEEMKIKAGFVLAGMEDMVYKTGSFKMEPGDRLYQYTDGVTEATNADNELYGMKRLTDFLNNNMDKDPENLLPAIRADIDEFVAGAPQFDDITMLSFEFCKYKE